MKTKIYNCVLCLVLAYLCLEFYGCVDTPIENKDNINGKVVDLYGFPSPRILVSTNQFPIVVTDLRGLFSLYTSQKPYSINLENNSIYKDITVDNPIITIPSNYPSVYNQCSARLTYPAFSSDNEAVFIHFMSPDISFMEGDIHSGSGITALNVAIPPEKSTISGKLIYLQYTFNTKNGEIYSYNKFGIREITLTAGSNNPDIEFTENNITYDPPEKQILIENLINNDGFGDGRLYLNYNGFNPNSGVKLAEDIIADFSVKIVPILPDSNFLIKATGGYINFTHYIAYGGEKPAYAKPGDNIIITHLPPQIIYPPNNKTNIIKSDTVEINKEASQNMYKFTLFYYTTTEGYKAVSGFFTDKRIIKISDFESENFSFNPNQHYRIYVTVYRNIGPMDNFLSQPYTLNKNYEGYELSEPVDFTTAP